MKFTGPGLNEFRGTQITSEGGAPSPYLISPILSSLSRRSPRTTICPVC